MRHLLFLLVKVARNSHLFDIYRYEEDIWINTRFCSSFMHPEDNGKRREGRHHGQHHEG